VCCVHVNTHEVDGGERRRGIDEALEWH
jgi:hypothetical protein